MQEGNNQDQPGAVIAPGGQQVPDSVSVPPAPQPSEPDTSQGQLEPPAIQPEVTAETGFAPIPAGDSQPAPDAPQTGLGEVSWTASEYLENPKNNGWFMLLALATVVVAAVIYFVTHDILSTGAIVIFGIIFAVAAARQPKTLTYRIDSRGIQIGQKFYPYTAFKAFSVGEEHAIGYISLLPLRRFMPALAVHYAPEDEEVIINTLADYLPYEDHKNDFVESLARRIRF